MPSRGRFSAIQFVVVFPSFEKAFSKFNIIYYVCAPFPLLKIVYRCLHGRFFSSMNEQRKGRKKVHGKENIYVYYDNNETLSISMPINDTFSK